MRRRLRKFLALPARDRNLLLNAFFLLAAVRLALWAMPFGAVRRWTLRLAVSRAVPDPVPVARLAGAIDLASRYVPRATCLTKALAAQILLTRRGHHPELRIGVRRDAAGKFEAHAWLEEGGAIIGGLDDLHTYVTLPPI